MIPLPKQYDVVTGQASEVTIKFCGPPEYSYTCIHCSYRSGSSYHSVILVWDVYGIDAPICALLPNGSITGDTSDPSTQVWYVVTAEKHANNFDILTDGDCYYNLYDVWIPNRTIGRICQTGQSLDTIDQLMIRKLIITYNNDMLSGEPDAKAV